MNDALLSLALIKRMLIDQRHIRRSPWRRVLKETQRDGGRSPLFRDRLEEVRAFFGLGWVELLRHSIRHGFPNSERFKSHLDSFFPGRIGGGPLQAAYREAAFFYSLRLMLAFERYSMLTGYLDVILSHWRERGKSTADAEILDYGCGVADAGLLFARLGARVTLCDLDDRKLAFAAWRFRCRGLPLEVMPVADTEVPPEVTPGRYDLIIASEVFEHVRNPLLTLRALTVGLKDDGLLFDSMGGRFERDLTGDHLPEALAIGNSPDYKAYYRSQYEQLSPIPGRECLFRRRTP